MFMNKSLSDKAVDISRIIRDESIIVNFQPIISIQKKATIGFEGLIRGLMEDGTVVPPLQLFSAAESAGRLLDLDRLCRKKIFAAFKKSFYASPTRQILFFNFETSLLDELKTISGYTMDICSHYKVNPQQVVIEIKESAVRNIKALKTFVEKYRDYGFHIAIDDVGAGHSNFARIPLVKPDIIKIDKSIIRDINKDYYKQESFRSIVNLSRKIGALVLAEGVETEAETLFCLEFGADLLQGYYFSEPGIAAELEGPAMTEITRRMANTFSVRMTEKIRSIKKQHDCYKEIISIIIKQLSSCRKQDEFDNKLKTIIDTFVYVDALYVLDEHGIQVTDTYLNYDIRHEWGLLFAPAKKGDDHSLKEYYFLPSNLDFEKYTTKSHVSLATGNICRTISTMFKVMRSRKYVLCVDFKENTIE